MGMQVNKCLRKPRVGRMHSTVAHMIYFLVGIVNERATVAFSTFSRKDAADDNQKDGNG